MLNQKTEIDLSEIAIFCASHSGEALHTEKVLKTAEKYLLNYEDIFCEKQIPFHAETYKSMIKENKPYTKLHNNCSGKHIGMLLFCKLLDLEIENYQEITHPIQQKIDLFYRELFNLEKITYGIDGCGLPAIPYFNQSWEFYSDYGSSINYLHSHPGYVSDSIPFNFTAPNLAGGLTAVKVTVFLFLL